MSRFFRRISGALFARRADAAPESNLSPLDLLRRAPINLDTPELQRFIGGKRILVTGAGGSIGSEICRQIMKFCPKRLVMIDRCENALFEIDRELRDTWIGADLHPIIADIGDRTRIDKVFAGEQFHVVFHAAAHKHVPMMELNPGEAIKNNIFGTKNVADAALAHRADAFVLISTDKAVNPTSVMGASKRVAELYVQSLNAQGVGCRVKGVEAEADSLLHPTPYTLHPASRTRFAGVRFGNVLGSSGSVVPIFQKQIAAGGPVTVTHSEMRRYFMTIPEASQLVMQAGAIGRGGEIFVLDMGEPVKIIDLAYEMIRRKGLVVGKDIEVRITGMRPGEKLFEELANDSDKTRPTSHAKIRVWTVPSYTPEQMQEKLTMLGRVLDGSRDEIVRTLMRIVPEYHPDIAPAESLPVVEAA